MFDCQLILFRNHPPPAKCLRFEEPPANSTLPCSPARPARPAWLVADTALALDGLVYGCSFNPHGNPWKCTFSSHGNTKAQTKDMTAVQPHSQGPGESGYLPGLQSFCMKISKGGHQICIPSTCHSTQYMKGTQ